MGTANTEKRPWALWVKHRNRPGGHIVVTATSHWMLKKFIETVNDDQQWTYAIKARDLRPSAKDWKRPKSRAQ